MGDSGKRDKGGREKQKPKLSTKEKKQKKREKKQGGGSDTFNG